MPQSNNICLHNAKKALQELPHKAAQKEVIRAFAEALQEIAKPDLNARDEMTAAACIDLMDHFVTASASKDLQDWYVEAVTKAQPACQTASVKNRLDFSLQNNG